jgi:hypothetical protein
VLLLLAGQSSSGIITVMAGWRVTICGNAWPVGKAGSLQPVGRVMIWPDPEHFTLRRRIFGSLS